MYITKEILQRYNACGKGYDWFVRYFPEGAELIEVINHKYVSPHVLHWGMANLTTSDEEKEAYRKKLIIDCGEYNYSIYESDNVVNSSYVTHSSRITDSKHVFHSEDITASNNILQSNNIENSSLVYGSEFVFDSDKVLQSKNVTNGCRVVCSDYVFNSHDIYNAASVKNSAFVGGLSIGATKRIDNCLFVADCEDLEHCMLCHNLHNKKYCLFNKEISVEEYEIIKRQMTSILAGWKPTLVHEDEWPSETIPLDTPRIERNIAKQYANLPEKFWRWVKTLPNYDPMVLYTITYNKNLL